jgi:hypothetical protein
VTGPTIPELADHVRRGCDADERTAQGATPAPWRAAHRIDGTHRVLGGPFPLPDTPSDTRVVHRDGGYTAEWPKEVVNPEVDADHIARHDPARVLAEVASKRALLDLALGWEHAVDDSGWCDCEQLIDSPCTCGRDERVRAVLTLLAQPYQEADHD